MKLCTKKKIPTANYSTHFIFKVRRQTTKSIEKFLKSCIANVVRNANTECSGARLEVSGSRLAEWGEVAKREEMRMKGHCYVHTLLQCHSRRLLELFPAFSNFRFSDPISVCSPLKLTKIV